MPGRPLGSKETRTSGPASSPGRETPRVAVIIPCLNAAATILPCLDAIMQAQRPIGLGEVVLVDNGSVDNTWDLVTERYGEALAILSAPGLTVAALRNLGLAATTADAVAFVDADCVVPADYFALALARLDSGNADGVGGSYLLPPNAGWIQRTWDALHPAPPEGLANWLLGGNAVYRRDALYSVGAFDARVVTGEDTDLGKRMCSRGLRLRHDPRLSIVHLHDPRTVRAFCAQQYWHGIGMWQRPRLSRPLAMTLLHALVTALPILAVLTGKLAPFRGLGLFVAGQALVPLASALYRVGQGGKWRFLPKGVLLYELYYLCRLAAMAALPRVTLRGRTAQGQSVK